MARLLNINFACENPVRLANFWAAALNYEVEAVPEEVVKELRAQGLEPDLAAGIRDKGNGGPQIYFEKKRVGHVVDRTGLEVGCGRDLEGAFVPVHLDLISDDRDAEIKRLVELGATVVEERKQSIGELSESFVVMRDPEGNGFCLH